MSIEICVLTRLIITDVRSIVAHSDGLTVFFSPPPLVDMDYTLASAQQFNSSDAHLVQFTTPLTMRFSHTTSWLPNFWTWATLRSSSMHSTCARVETHLCLCRSFKYDPAYPVRGLFLDKHNGNFLKVDNYGTISICVHGRRRWEKRQIAELYPGSGSPSALLFRQSFGLVSICIVCDDCGSLTCMQIELYSC